MGRKSLGLLIVAIFVGILAGNILGAMLKVVFETLSIENNVVQKVLVDNLVDYEFYPMRLNLLIMTVTFGFSLNFNVLALLGIGTAWYYVKYSY